MPDEKRVTRRKLNGDEVEVPAWAMVITYVLCWVFGALILLFEFAGIGVYRPVLVTIAIYLILWPVFQVSPAAMVRKLFSGGE